MKLAMQESLATCLLEDSCTMSRFIISALIAVSAGARLEGLEAAARGNSFGGATSNQYLPPFGGPSGPNGAGGFGGASGFGAQNGASKGFGQNSARGAPSRLTDATSNKYLAPFGGDSNSLSGNGPNAAGADDATSNKYLPPFQGPAGSRNGQYQQQAQFGAQGQPGQFGSQDQFGQGQNGQFGSQGQFGQNGQLGSKGKFVQGQQYGQNSQFGSSGQFGQYNQPGQQGQASFGGFQKGQQGQNRPGSQYQQIPLQDFDEETGYHY